MSEQFKEKSLSHLLTLAKKAGATHADALAVEDRQVSYTQRLGQPEDQERSESSGISLRVMVDGRIASASTSDLRPESLALLADRTVTMARYSTQDPYDRLATPQEMAKQWPALDLCEPQEPAFDWLREQAAMAEDAGRSMAGITNSGGATAAHSRTHFALATSEGFTGGYEATYSYVSVQLIAGSGADMQRDYSYSTARHSQDVLAADAIGRDAASRTLARLNARRVKSQAVPVIFEPRVARQLLSQFGSAISGAAVAKGTSFLKDHLGKPLFPESITIIDDPHRPRGLGSRPFDAEGVACERLAVVENGLLQHWLLDIRSGARLGLASNGRAVRGLGGNPSPSTSNFYLAAGTRSPEAMLADIDHGFYITDLSGSGANLINGDYSIGAQGHWIEKGQRSFPVSEVTIAGHLLEMFAGLEAANDLSFDYGTNSPSLLIGSMMVGGGE